MGKETFNSQLADSARDQVVRQRLRSRGQGENTVGNRLIYYIFQCKAIIRIRGNRLRFLQPSEGTADGVEARAVSVTVQLFKSFWAGLLHLPHPTYGIISPGGRGPRHCKRQLSSAWPQL